MFNNIVNGSDVADVFALVRRRGLRPIMRRLTAKRTDVVASKWGDYATERVAGSHWLECQAVVKRCNELISGDPTVDYIQYISAKYLRGRDLTGLSLGCGAGDAECEWYALNHFATLEGIDVSDPLIRLANEKARKHGFDRLKFTKRDVNSTLLTSASYDVIFGEHALHHFAHLDELFGRIARALKPDGLLVMNEFVGPTRFQWTERQLEVVNGALAIVPAKYRRMADGRVKTWVSRPGRLRMILSDPSESVDSSSLLPAFHKHFDVVEFRPFGGTILQLLLHRIAGNFQPDDPQAVDVLHMLFQIEDTAIRLGDVSNDFVVAIGQPRGSSRTASSGSNGRSLSGSRRR